MGGARDRRVAAFLLEPPQTGGIGQAVKQALRIAAGSIAVGLAVFGLRTAAWWVTGSAALFSDAAESVVNVAAAALALFALRLSAMPPDASHPYGHTKVEFISAVLEGVLIVVAAGTILVHACDVYLHPAPIEAPIAGHRAERGVHPAEPRLVPLAAAASASACVRRRWSATDAT